MVKYLGEGSGKKETQVQVDSQSWKLSQLRIIIVIPGMTAMCNANANGDDKKQK